MGDIFDQIHAEATGQQAPATTSGGGGGDIFDTINATPEYPTPRRRGVPRRHRSRGDVIDQIQSRNRLPGRSGDFVEPTGFERAGSALAEGIGSTGTILGSVLGSIPDALYAGTAAPAQVLGEAIDNPSSITDRLRHPVRSTFDTLNRSMPIAGLSARAGQDATSAIKRALGVRPNAITDTSDTIASTIPAVIAAADGVTRTSTGGKRGLLPLAGRPAGGANREILSQIDAELDSAALARDQHAALPTPDPAVLSSLDDHIAKLTDIRTQLTSPTSVGSSIPTRARAAVGAVGNIARGRPVAALRSAADALERPTTVSPKALRASASAAISSSPAPDVLARIPARPSPAHPDWVTQLPQRPTFAGDIDGTLYDVSPIGPSEANIQSSLPPSGPTIRSTPLEPLPTRTVAQFDASAKSRAMRPSLLDPRLSRPTLPPSNATSSGVTWAAGPEGLSPDSSLTRLPGRRTPAEVEGDWTRRSELVRGVVERDATEQDLLHASTSDGTPWDDVSARARNTNTVPTRPSTESAPTSTPTPSTPSAMELGDAPGSTLHVSEGDEVRFSKGNRRLHGKVKSIVDTKYGPAAKIGTTQYGTHTVPVSQLTRLGRPSIEPVEPTELPPPLPPSKHLAGKFPKSGGRGRKPTPTPTPTSSPKTDDEFGGILSDDDKLLAQEILKGMREDKVLADDLGQERAGRPSIPAGAARVRSGELQINGARTPEHEAAMNEAMQWVSQRFPRASKLVDNIQILPDFLTQERQSQPYVGEYSMSPFPGEPWPSRTLGVTEGLVERAAKTGNYTELVKTIVHELQHRAQVELGMDRRVSGDPHASGRVAARETRTGAELRGERPLPQRLSDVKPPQPVRSSVPTRATQDDAMSRAAAAAGIDLNARRTPPPPPSVAASVHRRLATGRQEGEMTSITRLRQEMGAELPGKAFDDALLGMWWNGELDLQSHPTPSAMTPTERAASIPNHKSPGTFFTAAVSRKKSP